MFSHLPPLQSLRALEAAARHRSFTRAADELNLTHSAVSHHMRSLEQQLGTALFRRVGARMIPTSVGARLAERVRIGMSELDEAFTEARAGTAAGGAPGTVRLEVSVMTDLASQWMIPRLARFSERHPGIDLMVRVHADIAAPDPYSVDVGVWHQRVEETGFVTRKLLDDYVIAVCHPDLIARVPGFTVADTPRLPMLRFAHRSWRDWLVAAGLPPHEPTRGPIFDDSGLLLRAAIAGQGVATTRSLLVRDTLASGELVQVGDIRIPPSLEYHVSWRENHPRERAIHAFWQWMQDEIAATAPLGPPSVRAGERPA
ncbi:LysR family transcriptional regulator [Pandoraea nosoerga]|uniref:Glycine cleavage system regulatory protein n=1 Tax=Pandoraea nosoerga TaxID=2508296 RepID=A0A5E4XFE2_9BURK|nr:MULTISPECIES: LysR substrate-binding domain-containing protein [Pandoraea]MBN4666153.1 LysR family transcriptional regulator [Pandoraea nosoerga]MBN4676944.1 LysR family transcriptional regulator [Pandoraea nosoerga]MBN4681613.1 LysR family transcriptional regulator [Pandoraea nosoerga]MBN4745153.1 LysR family transcriptional regulator [Pandoraea nosoerga]VVE34932.1 glycine cleavage system regulatory protein [Pandoraea nosoerga]